MKANTYKESLAEMGWMYQGQCGVCSIRKYKYAHPDHPNMILRITPGYQKFELLSNGQVISQGTFSTIETQLAEKLCSVK